VASKKVQKNRALMLDIISDSFLQYHGTLVTGAFRLEPALHAVHVTIAYDDIAAE
jgi:hypothetical protein